MNDTHLGASTAKLGFGFMRLPKKENNAFNMDLIKKMVDVFLAEGFTYFDTAYLYPGAEDAYSFFETSLKRTAAGYFDFYMFHALNAVNSEKAEKLGAWQFIHDLKESGKIRHFGFSFHGSPEALEIILNRHPDVEFVQLQINYLDWNDEKVQARRCYEIARTYGIPISIMEPIKGGLLADTPKPIADILNSADASASSASWALRFTASLDGVITILSGMNSLEQMYDNIATIKNFKPLSQNDHDIIAKVIEKYRSIPRIPCTGCRYCVDDCPQKINIPNLIDIYSDYMIYHSKVAGKDMYPVLSRKGGKASDCIQCRTCERHCPQEIEIANIMKNIAKVFE